MGQGKTGGVKAANIRKQEIQAIASDSGISYKQAEQIYNNSNLGNDAIETNIDNKKWTDNKYLPWNWKYQESGMSGTVTGGIKIADVELGEYKNLTSEGVRSSITGELVNQNNNNNNNTNPPKGEWKNPWEGINKHSGRSGARQKLPANLRYPYSTIDDTQDFLRFSIFEYERDRKFISQGNRSLSGEQGNLRDLRDLLGSIILPIPAQLADTNSTGWGDSNVNQLESMAYEGADAAISGNFGTARGKLEEAIDVLGNNSNLVKGFFAKKAINSLIGGNMTFNQLLARNQGEIINPNMELLFSGPTLRNFSFNFKLTPRYKKEAEVIRTIIKAFKRNMAPKGSGGTMLRTPNIFQIDYLGRARNYLNRMKLCALKGVAVNYTGDGTFATYQDGAPISSTLTLSFTELTPIYNEDYGAYDDNSDGVGY